MPHSFHLYNGDKNVSASYELIRRKNLNSAWHIVSPQLALAAIIIIIIGEGSLRHPVSFQMIPWVEGSQTELGSHGSNIPACATC